jgi:hypothetical protein
VNISDEAVEAAAKLLYNESGDDEVFLAEVRAALEAAAPHLMAAWINDTSRLPRDLPGYGPDGSVGAGE